MKRLLALESQLSINETSKSKENSMTLLDNRSGTI